MERKWNKLENAFGKNNELTYFELVYRLGKTGLTVSQCTKLLRFGIDNDMLTKKLVGSAGSIAEGNCFVIYKLNK